MAWAILPRPCDASEPRRASRSGISQPDDSVTLEEAQRRRRSSANRVLTILKAALNHAWREGRVARMMQWRRVKPFPGTVRSADAIPHDQECQRLINASDPAFRLLVQAALFTGADIGTGRLAIEDFNARCRHAAHNQEQVRQAAARRLDRRRHGIFRRLVGRPWWRRSVLPRTRGGAVGEVVPAAPDGLGLRARANRACRQLPCAAPFVGFVVRHGRHAADGCGAQLGHASTKMVEQHYGHLAPSYVADAIRASAPSSGTSVEQRGGHREGQAMTPEQARQLLIDSLIEFASGAMPALTTGNIRCCGLSANMRWQSASIKSCCTRCKMMINEVDDTHSQRRGAARKARLARRCPLGEPLHCQ